jgi:hypothetical protein
LLTYFLSRKCSLQACCITANSVISLHLHPGESISFLLYWISDLLDFIFTFVVTYSFLVEYFLHQLSKESKI